jgi:molecular chaperone DnaK (HSP70)
LAWRQDLPDSGFNRTGINFLCDSKTASPVRDGGKSMVFRLYESENTDRMYMPDDGVEIGSVSVTGLVDSKKSDVFEISFGIDRSGLLSAKAIEKKTGKTVTTEIQLMNFLEEDLPRDDGWS